MQQVTPLLKEGVRFRRLSSRSRLYAVILVVLLFGVFLLALNVYQLRVMQHGQWPGQYSTVEGVLDKYDKKKPTIWLFGKKLGSGYLKHVISVFTRLGYVQGDDPADWDVLWAHDYPFVQLKSHLSQLKPYQKVNHFPGSGFITNKVSLATSDIKYIPKAFKIPHDKKKFFEYAKNHPEQKWVQKSNNHRGVKIKSIKELDLTSENTFIQEYVDEPFLIDDRRFDIGIYTTLTSINPLRVYIYQGDWLIRFCPKVYYPFDAADRDKYVITDDYRPVWKVPSLQKMYTDLDFTRKEALLAYLRNKGLDGVKLDSDLQAAIRGVYLDKESSLIDSLSRYPSSRNFFEMVRFDFVLDKHLNIYLMEVNMSPNLSSGHFSDNKLLYEQVIYSMLSLVGLARAVNNDFARSGTDERNMQVSSKDVHVYLNECLSDKCNSNCISEECKFCGMCVKSEDLEHMTAAYMEHSNRQTWRRVFPVPFKDQFTAQVWEPKQDQDYQKLNERNQWMTLWFHGKCLQDSSWCR